MKKSIFTLALVFAALTTGLTSCTTPAEDLNKSQQNVEKAQEELDKAKEEYRQQYETFKVESQDEITANEKLIADLKQYSKTKKEEAKVDYDRTIAELELKNEELKQKINNYSDENAEAWEDFKIEFKKDIENLGDALKDFNKNDKK